MPEAPRLSRAAATSTCATDQRRERVSLAGRVLTRCRPPTPVVRATCADDARPTVDGRCVPLGLCPADPWPSGLDPAQTVFVDAGAPGGDGSATRPFGRFVDALAVASGRVIVVRGRIDDAVVLRGPRAIVGVCPSGAQLAGRVVVDGEVSLTGLALLEGVQLASGARLDLARSRVAATSGAVVSGEAGTSFRATEVRISGPGILLGLGAGSSVTLDDVALVRGVGTTLGTWEGGELVARRLVSAGVGGAVARGARITLVDTAWADVEGGGEHAGRGAVASRARRAARPGDPRRVRQPGHDRRRDAVARRRRGPRGDGLHRVPPRHHDRGQLRRRRRHRHPGHRGPFRGTGRDDQGATRDRLQRRPGELRADGGRADGGQRRPDRRLLQLGRGDSCAVLHGPARRALLLPRSSCVLEDVVAEVEVSGEVGSATVFEEVPVAVEARTGPLLSARRVELRGGFVGLWTTALDTEVQDLDLGPSPMRGRGPDFLPSVGILATTRVLSLERVRVHDRWQVGAQLVATDRTDVRDLTVERMSRLEPTTVDPCFQNWALGLSVVTTTGTLERVAILGLPGRPIELSSPGPATFVVRDVELQGHQCRALKVSEVQSAAFERLTITSSSSVEEQVLIAGKARVAIEDLSFDVPKAPFVLRADAAGLFEVSRWLVRSSLGLIDLGLTGTVGQQGPPIQPRIFRDGTALELNGGVTLPGAYCTKLRGETLLLRAQLPADARALTTCP